ncbi:MAG: type II secretion system protein [Planctomycetota bacterium]|jgi:prepilin-type N-terminal cleavage/methylation domain-containing protein
MMRPPARHHGRAFTLVELMVVIGIIGALMTLLLPSLLRGRELAYDAVCKANIRHLALANAMYTENNNGYYPLAAEDVTGANLKRWHGWRETVNDPFKLGKAPLAKYLGADQIKACPAFRGFGATPGFGAAFESGGGGYGYNDTYVGGRSDKHGYGEASKHSANVLEVGDPARTVMFTDTARITPDGLIEYSFCHPPYWQFDPQSGPSNMTTDAAIHFRHLDRVNVAWVNTSVSEEELEFTFAYKTNSTTAEMAEERGFGWFGPMSNEWFDLE